MAISPFARIWSSSRASTACAIRARRRGRRSSGLACAGRADQLASELSGGWKQRLALGACTLPDPALLLLDEPTAGVDPKARRDFWDEIHRLAESGLTVLVSTHYMDEAERCHRIAYIAAGRLLVSGTTADIIAGGGPRDLRRHRPGSRCDCRSGCPRRPASKWSRCSAWRCMCRAATRARLDEIARDFGKDPAHVWAKGAPTLEDVFIDLMIQAGGAPQ